MNNIVNSLIKLLQVALDTTTSSKLSVVEDSKAVAKLAYYQEVAPLLYEAIQKLYEAGQDVFPDKDAKLRIFQQALTQENLYKTNKKTMEKLSNLFETAGIAMYVLKGVSIAQYYPKPQYRFSCDMDCILADLHKNTFVSRFEEGNRLIESKSVNVHRDYYKHSEFRIGGLYVENHRFCCSIKRGKRTKALEAYLQSLLSPSFDEKVGDLYFPPLMFQAIFMIEHACSHFLYEKINLKHICDWAMFRKANIDKLDWQEFRTQCERFKLWNFVEAMNRLADLFIGEKEYDDLSLLEKRMLNDTLNIIDYVDSKNVRRFKKAIGVLKSSWKYKYYGHSSMLKEFCTTFFAYLFQNDPKLA